MDQGFSKEQKLNSLHILNQYLKPETMKKKNMLTIQILLFVSVFLFSCNNNLDLNEKTEDNTNTSVLKNTALSTENLDYNTFGFYYNWYGNAEFDNGYFHWGHDILPGPGQSTSPG